ncbi:MAG TPA: phosphoribosyltransferase [Verrucomicrobiae bacterium]|jgi:putative phosphoribosyl transferase|nr:phosphoribosyltransferase [Verrucomicrobiae bacterium]
MSFRFRDRRQAGRFLADKLEARAGDHRVIVLALPRGGVPVGFEVARRLGAPLDIFLVRKLGAPGEVELALGAVATGGVSILNEEIIASLGISHDQVREIMERERTELHRRELLYRPSAERLNLNSRIVILVDDGLATGATMRASVAAVREEQPARTVVAVPVASPDTYALFQRLADETVCVQTPKDFRGVGQWYENFTQTSDDEVRALLEEAAAFREPAPAAAGAKYADL